MKVRDISLVATGAIFSVALIALTFTVASPPKAQAQTAAAPGVNAMTVANIPQNANGTSGNQGMIAINDSINRKVTVVSYFYSGSAAGSTAIVSTPVSYTY
jgi:hypothetical protein